MWLGAHRDNGLLTAIVLVCVNKCSVSWSTSITGSSNGTAATWAQECWGFFERAASSPIAAATINSHIAATSPQTGRRHITFHAQTARVNTDKFVGGVRPQRQAAAEAVRLNPEESGQIQGVACQLQ
jgi:hypothetical protein